MRHKLESILENSTAQAILAYMTAYRHPRGGPPSLREICEACNVSMGYTSKLVKRLADEGHLIKKGRDWRGADIPHREEIEATEAMERRHARMRGGK